MKQCRPHKHHNKQPDYARTTITVPRPLKRRMKRLGPLVNWSAVATAAFREKLKQLDPNQETCTIEAVVERLRQAKHDETAADPDVADGQQAGRRWAMQSATLPQLQRLAALKESKTDEEWQKFFSGPRCGIQLVRHVAPKVQRPRQFWMRHLGRDTSPSPLFFAAFAAGALEVWEQVKNQV